MVNRDTGGEAEAQPVRGPDDGGLPTQRVRIGAIGLASVFLLVLLAASVFGLIGRGTSRTSGTLEANGAATVNGQDAPKDPLAELGVAPGNAPEHPVENGSVAATPTHASPVR